MVSRILAALDIGSGEHRVQIASVENNEITHTHVILLQELSLALVLAKQHTKIIPDYMLKLSRAIIERFIWLAREVYHVEQISITFTSVFRLTLNGKEYIDSIAKDFNTRCTIITQEDEARLSWLTATAILKELGHKSISNCISLDIGSQSHQITWKEDDEFKYCNGLLGISNVYAKFIRDVRREEFNIHSQLLPCAYEELKELNSKLIESLEDITFKNSLNSYEVVALASQNSPFALVCEFMHLAPVYSCQGRFRALNMGYPNKPYIKDQETIFFSEVSPHALLDQLEIDKSQLKCELPDWSYLKANEDASDCSLGKLVIKKNDHMINIGRIKLSDIDELMKILNNKTANMLTSLKTWPSYSFENIPAGICLSYAHMKKIGINSILVLEALGNTIGILLDPTKWDLEKI